MIPIKFHAPWHRLRSTWVGRTYLESFYAPIKNPRIRHALMQIARETEEDYKNIITTLESLGVSVLRPAIDDTVTIMDFVNAEGQVNYGKASSFTLIPRPPMQPRDSLLVIADRLIGTQEESTWFHPDCEKSQLDFDAPLVTVVGDRVIVDSRDNPWLPEYIQTIAPNHQIIPVMIGGHNDAVFCPVRPGLIVSTHHHDSYNDTFPGWEVKFIENQSWNAIPGWRKIKHANVGKWWAPAADNNAEFADFVNTWLDHWLGYVSETVFDVNMLQIDHKTILVNNYNKEMFDFFRSRGIEPIITPFRHRFFWDGGIHCITGDLYREGERETYI